MSSAAAVEEGGRHHALTSEAAKLRNRGFAGADLRAELHKINATYKPPLSPAEVEKIATWADRQPGRTSTADANDAEPTAPNYPSRDVELSAFIPECFAVDAPEAGDAQVFLNSRKLNVARLAAVGTVAALVGSPKLPECFRVGRRSWGEAGYRLVVMLFDADGVFRSVHARHWSGPAKGPKAVSPTGYSTKGLIMADPVGVSMLRGEADERIRRASRGRHGVGVVICEGVPDWLLQQSAYALDDDQAPAVLGTISGAWTREHAARVPDGATVLIATDLDAAGEAYAQKIIETFKGRGVAVRRWRPTCKSQ